MAIIQISESTNWSTARWIFDNLIEDVLSDLSGNNHLKEQLKCSIQDGSYFLDLRNMEKEDKLIFSKMVRSIYDRVRENGAGSFNSPEFYNGFINKLEELIVLLEKG